jgi:hypothetical protein
MPIKVFHSKRARFFDEPFPVWPDPENWDEVAIVESDNLEDAYHLTQTVDFNWTRRTEGIKVLVTEARSTGVGDVLVSSDGVPHRVLFAGFGPA